MSQVNNILQVRLWTPEDYPVFAEWWSRHHAAIIPERILPKTGYVLEREGAPTCAIFAYLTVDLGVAHLRFILSEPGKSLKQARDDFEILFGGAKAALKALGYNVYFVDCAESVAREAEKVGFTICSRGNVFLMLAVPLDAG